MNVVVPEGAKNIFYKAGDSRLVAMGEVLHSRPIMTLSKMVVVNERHLVHYQGQNPRINGGKVGT